jgi:uncharacterized protein (TIGR04141 family)
MEIKDKKEKKHCLTIFLLKEQYKKLDDVVIPDGVIKEFDALDNKAKAFLYKNNDRKPAWVNTFSDIFDCSNINNLIHALIIYIEIDDRIFVITTSFGHTKIRKEYIVNDFGLKVVLNKIDKKSLRSIDVRKLTLSSHQRREVSSSNSSLESFDFNSNEDFLKAISGKLDDDFAASLSGSDSLNVVKRFNIKEIQDFCRELLILYEKNDYKTKGYDFIDNLKKVYNSETYLKTREAVVEAINKRDSSEIILAYPEIEEYNFCNYRISFNSKKEYLDDINIIKFFKFLDNNGIDKLTEDNLKNIKIELLDEDGDIYKNPKVKRSYSLLDYLVFELDDDGSKYIYISGQLYLIDKDYYLGLCEFLKEYENNELSVELPEIKYKMVINKKGKNVLKVEEEKYYNKRIENKYVGNVICFDRHLFRTKFDGKKSEVEICDILTENKEFICIKIYKNSSAALSHLFFQGSVSAELLAELKEYKKEIIKEAKEKFKIKLDNRPEIKFVFAIAVKNSGYVFENLPIFSKISLRKAIFDIAKMGFAVQVTKINFETEEDSAIL